MGRRIVLFTVTAVVLLDPVASKTTDQEFVWARSMGGSVADDHGYSVFVDESGYVYTTGDFEGTADFDPGPEVYNLTSAGGSDIFVSKLDASGTFVWARRMGGYGGDSGSSVTVDHAGNVYTTGFFHGTADFDPDPDRVHNLNSPLGNEEVFISKLDSRGDFMWARQLGGSTDAVGTSLIVDPRGNVYTTGVFRGTADFDPDPDLIYNLTSTTGSDDDIFVSKLDADGNFVWAKRMGGGYFDIGSSIAVDRSGDVYTTGYFSGSADFDPGPGADVLTSDINIAEVFVSKLDSKGAFVWAKRMGGNRDDVGSSIAVDRRGNVYTTGSFQGTADFDPDPDVIYNLTSTAGRDIFVSKLDSDGRFIWARGMGGTQDDGGSSIAVDHRGNVYSTGSFVASADFDPGPGVYNIRAGYRDIFVSKLNADGDFVWAKSVGASSDDGGHSIALDNSGDVYVTGYFTGTVDFDLGTGIYPLVSSGRADAFILKLGCDDCERDRAKALAPPPPFRRQTLERAAIRRSIPAELLLPPLPILCQASLAPEVGAGR